MVVISIHGGLLHGNVAQEIHIERHACKMTEAVQHKRFHYCGTDAKFNFGLSKFSDSVRKVCYK